jgi:predicted GTPase
MGYSDQQVADLQATIAKVPCDTVIVATPIDLRRIVSIEQPSARVRYELQEIGDPTLEQVLRDFFARR